MKKGLFVFLLFFSFSCGGYYANTYLQNKNLSPEIGQAIAEHRVVVGMNKGDVEASIGRGDYFPNDNEWIYFYYGYHIYFIDARVANIALRDGEITRGIQNSSAAIGMTKEEVLYALGEPYTRTSEKIDNSVLEYWRYWQRWKPLRRRGPFWFITFKDGVVIKVAEDR